MAIRKYLDWRGWLKGFYLKWIDNVTSTFLALVTTNGAQAMGIPNIGITWQGALGLFGTLTVIEAVKYLKAQPLPPTITETSDTQQITK